MRYLVDAKQEIEDPASLQHDLFVAAYNDSVRVAAFFERVGAKEKRWWILPEYGFTGAELGHLSSYQVFESFSESSLIIQALSSDIQSLKEGRSLLVDITGLMRSHILFILWYLKSSGISKVDMVYTEPTHYSRKAETTFTEEIAAVRQIAGFEGAHQPVYTNDVLILGVGYDDASMGRVILDKENASLIQLRSLPSLSADMYQESLLRLDLVAGVESRPADGRIHFSSANDPYVTADTLSGAWRHLNAQNPITNLYLSPLATKVQALGFGLFYLQELVGHPASIILPEVRTYSKKTSTGIGRSWLYPVHL